MNSFDPSWIKAIQSGMVIGCLLSPWISLQAHGACTEATPPACDINKSPNLIARNTQNRVQAMKACLALVAHPAPKKLFTYGHPDKIKNALTLSKRAFWVSVTGLQEDREERVAIGMMQQLFSSLKLKSAQINAVIDKGASLSNSHSSLDEILSAYEKEKPLGHKQLDHEAFLPYQLAAFSKFFPNIFKDLRNPENLSPQSAENRLARARSSVDLHRSQASLLASKLPAGSFESTGGRGVYLSENPSQTLEHAGGPSGKGLMCELSHDVKLINFDNECTKKHLQAAKIALPEMQNLSEQERLILSPSSKNIYSAPELFEEASQGFIVAFRPSKLSYGPYASQPPFYVDKNAISFQSCKEISIRDFENCDDFSGLLGLRKDSQFFGSIPDFIVEEPGFQENFLQIASSCSGGCGSEPQKAIFDQIITRYNQNNPFKFRQKHLSQIKKFIRSCGCDLGIRGSLSQLLTKKLIVNCGSAQNFCPKTEANSLEGQRRRLEKLNQLTKTLFRRVKTF